MQKILNLFAATSQLQKLCNSISIPMQQLLRRVHSMHHGAQSAPYDIFYFTFEMELHLKVAVQRPLTMNI